MEEVRYVSVLLAKIVAFKSNNELIYQSKHYSTLYATSNTCRHMMRTMEDAAEALSSSSKPDALVEWTTIHSFLLVVENMMAIK